MAHHDRRGQRTLVAGGLVVLLVAVGALLVRGGRPDTASTDETTERRSAEDQQLGMPQASEGEATSAASRPSRDEAGAVTAAVRYSAASQRWLYLTDNEVAAAVAEIATPGAARSLADETVEEMRVARDELVNTSGRVWWLVHPLAWRVESFSAGSASIAVWTVTVLSATGVAVPQTEWMTVTVDLAWVDDGWRVDAIRDRPGPTPMTGPQDDPWDAQQFDDSLDGFTRLDGEPTT
jgi:hypothetical protein